MEKLRALQKKYGVSNSKSAAPAPTSPAAPRKGSALQPLPVLNGRPRSGSGNSHQPTKVVAAAAVSDLDLGEGPNLASIQKRIKSMGAQSTNNENGNANFADVAVQPVVVAVDPSPSPAPLSATLSTSSPVPVANGGTSGGATSLENLKKRLEMIKQNSSA